MSTDSREAVELLSKVPILASVNEHGLRWLLGSSTRRHFAPGAKLLVELEPGDTLLILLRGRATVTVGGATGDAPTVLGEVKPGDVIGEVTLFTGEVRSASVVASEDVEAMVVTEPVFRRLLERFPAVALHCSSTLARRLDETEHTIEAVLGLGAPGEIGEERKASTKAILDQAERRLRTPLHRGVAGLYHELVKGRGQDLAFLMLVSFACAVVVARVGIGVVRATGLVRVDPVFRATYVAGLLLLSTSALFAIRIHRRSAVRVLASLFGAGMGLLLNGMSALMAFDIFYRHDWTPDPNFQFSMDVLYDRHEGLLFIAVAAALLIQAAYLRRFYLRVLNFTLYRLSRWWSSAPRGS